MNHKFVEIIPDQIEEGILYISIGFRTAIHKCACGCGNKVVTPLSPKEWRLTFDGKTVSLSPEINNRNFGCKSYYFIKRDKIHHSRRWDDYAVVEREEDFGSKKKSSRKSKKRIN